MNSQLVARLRTHMTDAETAAVPPIRVLAGSPEPWLNVSLSRAERAKRLDVDIALDGWAVAVLALDASYDVILLQMTPDLGMVELCRQLRETDVTTPILVIDPAASTDDIVLGLEAGADAYVAETITYVELLTRLEAMKRRKHYSSGRTRKAPESSGTTQKPEPDQAADTTQTTGTTHTAEVAVSVVAS